LYKFIILFTEHIVPRLYINYPVFNNLVLRAAPLWRERSNDDSLLPL